MTRIMIDLLDLPVQKVEMRERDGNNPDEGKCIYSESSVLFITQLADNGAEIKRRGRLQKRGNYDAVRPYEMDAARMRCSHISVSRSSPCVFLS